MSVIDNARAALAEYTARNAYGQNPLAVALRDLIAEHERLTAEMQQRELHHFETEALLTQAGIDPDGKAEWEYAIETYGRAIVPAYSESHAQHMLGDLRYRTGRVVGRPKVGLWKPLTDHTDRTRDA